MKRSNSIIIAVVALIVIVGGGYAIFHKSSKSSTSNSSTQSTAPAVNNEVLITKTDSSVGQYLADPSGMPLYTYNADTSGVSNCTGSCLTSWPAYQDKGSTTNLPAGVATIKRTDNGQIQYTYMGMPLYYFVSDSPGKVTGDGVQNFKIAKPSSAGSNSSSSTNSSSQPSQSNSSSSSGYSY